MQNYAVVLKRVRRGLWESACHSLVVRLARTPLHRFFFSNNPALLTNKRPLLNNNQPLLNNTWHNELLHEHFFCGSILVLNDIHTFLYSACLLAVDSVNMFYHIGLVSRQHTDAVCFFS